MLLILHIMPKRRHAISGIGDSSTKLLFDLPHPTKLSPLCVASLVYIKIFTVYPASRGFTAGCSSGSWTRSMLLSTGPRPVRPRSRPGLSDCWTSLVSRTSLSTGKWHCLCDMVQCLLCELMNCKDIFCEVG